MTPRPSWALVIFLLMPLAACDPSLNAPDPGAQSRDLPDDFAPTGDEFLVVVLPDTQIYARDYPLSFEAQLRWIVENAERYKIVFVSHVGDVVHNASEQVEWDAARAAYSQLDEIDLPHGFAIGGHDTSSTLYSEPIDSSCSPFSTTDCSSADYLANFGPQHYQDRSWFGGASPSGRSSYQLIQAGGMELLFLHLLQDTPEAELNWADGVLSAHPSVLAHVTTHRYLYDYRLTDFLPAPLNLLPGGRFSSITYDLGDQHLLFDTGLEASEFFARLIAPHPSVWAVHCGHVDGELRQQAVNEAGLPVHEILIDFQEMADGGGGWLRLLKFKPSSNQVESLTFSTTSFHARGNGDGFEHSLSLLRRYRDAYSEDLVELGLDGAELDLLLEEVAAPGPERDGYYESLYGSGLRDSRFVLDVNFSDYISAAR